MTVATEEKDTTHNVLVTFEFNKELWDSLPDNIQEKILQRIKWEVVSLSNKLQLQIYRYRQEVIQKC